MNRRYTKRRFIISRIRCSNDTYYTKPVKGGIDETKGRALSEILFFFLFFFFSFFFHRCLSRYDAQEAQNTPVAHGHR